MLVANWKEVAAKSWSNRAIYLALALQFTDMAIKALSGDADMGLSAETRLRILTFLGGAAAVLRILSQVGLATATERKLQAERITRKRLEAEVTKPTPPLTPQQVRAIKKDAAAEANGAGPVLTPGANADE